MASGNETTLQAVHRLWWVERLHPSEIKDRLGAQVSRGTIDRYVRQVIKDETAKGNPIPLRVTSSTRKGGLRTLSELKVVSPRARAIGAKLNLFRMRNDEMSTREFCQRYQFSNPRRLVEMESGRYDFTTSDLERLSEIMKVTWDKLTEPPNLTANPGK